MFEKLLSIDRRIIFIFVAVALILPLFLNISQYIAISPEVSKIYDGLEELKPGSKVLFAFDYDPPSAPELQPMAEAVLKYCFKNKLKVYIIGLWPQGPMQANLAIEVIRDDPQFADTPPVYDQNYVNLGFMSGNELVIQGMGSSFQSTFPRDYQGTPTADLEMMNGVNNFSNIDYIFNLSAGYPGTVEWVLFAVDRFHATLGAGNTAVQAPQIYPYFHAGQLQGLAGGLKGAAELEKLVGFYGKGTKFMLSQSFAHLTVIFFIIIGNIAYFATRGKKKQ
ncbi:MAG: hypothetical protein GF307_14545 [candidate division Zixibacteria bacterium]|nr:hypothetical protein [candidate division Zixibacteria bacterium]